MVKPREEVQSQLFKLFGAEEMYLGSVHSLAMSV